MEKCVLMKTDLKQLNKAIVEGDAKKAVEVTKAALAEGATPLDLIQNHMIPAMDEVGKLFEEEEYFVPELLLSGRAMRGAFDLIRPLMVAEDFSVYGTKVPALFLILGTRNRAKGIESVNHTADFDIDEAALPLGVRTLVTLALDTLRFAKTGSR